VIHRGFLSPVEVSFLVSLWKRTPGKRVRDYQFHGCQAPVDLTFRTLDLLTSASPEAKFLDSFFIHYLPNFGIAPHVDARSWSRVNVLLIKPPLGGQLIIEGEVQDMDVGDAVVFEPRLQEHMVTPVVEGERLIWSLGLSNGPSPTVSARNGTR
jgi:hypothetical protein